MILNQKQVQEKILDEVAQEIKELETSPTLAIIRVGNDFGSISYEKSICNILRPLGIKVETTELDSNIKLDELNKDSSVSGILVFKPLPKHIDEKRVNETINPIKDVDGTNPLNLGKLLINDQNGLVPPTPQAVLEVLDFYGIDTVGKDVVIINRSNLFGKPLSLLMINKDATVTICNSKTNDLESHINKADILVTATGVSGLIKPEMLNENMTVIDATITNLKDNNGKPVKDDNGKTILSGDVTESCNTVAENILSVTPNCGGGIGPITTSLLAKNVVKAFKQGNKIGNN